MGQETEHQETSKDEKLIGHFGFNKVKKDYQAFTRKPSYCGTGLVFSILLTVVVVLVAALGGVVAGLVAAQGVTASDPCAVSEEIVIYTSCPNGWIGFLGKCYYFSEEEADWLSSLRNCSSLGASLSFIETELEMGFLLRYKGPVYHWIGLRKDQGKPWKWANGSVFNNTLFDLVEGGDCAYLNDVKIMSSWCKTKKNWICSKPQILTCNEKRRQKEKREM